MLSRRGVVAGVGVWIGRRETYGKPSQPRATPDFTVPRHACDCHTHIFGDPRNFPMWSGRSYTPPPAVPREMSALHRRLGVERVVIVTPSIYGADNSSTIYGMKARKGASRGIAVIDERTSNDELNTMAKAGICGIRLNLSTGSDVDPGMARQLLTRAFDRVASRNWHVQVYTNLKVIAAVETVVSAAPVPFVIDHVAQARPAAGTSQPGFDALLRLLQSGKAYVKVTHRFLPSGTAPGYADSGALLKAVIEANADRVLWGTDWPHPDSSSLPGRKPTDVAPLLDIDDGLWFNRFAKFVSSAKLLEKILAENPARLYGF